MSSEEFDRTIPVNLPTVNKTNPRAHSLSRDHLMLPSRSVASQVKTFTPVGIAIITVADVK